MNQSRRSPARSSGWCSAASWRRSTGGWCSWVSVPVGIFGTVWAYWKLRGARRAAAGPHRLVGQRHVRASGLIAVLVGDHLRHPAVRRAHDGLDEPDRARRAARRARRCWPSSSSSSCASRSRCSSSTSSASGPSRRATSPTLLASLGRGGLQFMLIIWLQGIWLPLHGYASPRRRSGRASTCCR